MLSLVFIISVLFGEKEVYEEILFNLFYCYFFLGDEVLVCEVCKVSEGELVVLMMKILLIFLIVMFVESVLLRKM